MQSMETPSLPSDSFSSLLYYDGLRKKASRVDRLEGSNLDVLHFDSDHGNHSSLPDTPQPLAPQPICHIINLLGFSDELGNPDFRAYQDAYMVALAVHDLNTAADKGSFTTTISTSTSLLDEEVSRTMARDCPNLKFTYEASDIVRGIDSALNKVVDQTIGDSRGPGVGKPKPCTFVGAFRSALSIPTSMITGLRGYVQVSGASTSRALDDTSAHPLFARTMGSDNLNAAPLLKFLRDDLGVRRLAVLHLNEAFGISYAESLKEKAQEQFPDFSILTVSIPYGNYNNQTIHEGVRTLRLTRYRYFFVAIFDVFDEVMTEAYHQGIAGNDKYTWLFADSIEPSQILARTFDRDSVLHKVYQGIGIVSFTSSADSDYQEYKDKILSQLNRKRGFDYIANQVATASITKTNQSTTGLVEDLTAQPTLSQYADFFYDATIAAGLSACRATNRSGSTTMTLDGKQQYQKLLDLEFGGASGRIAFDKATGTRTTTVLGLSNFVEDEGTSNETTVQFKQVPTFVFDGQWSKVTDFIFQSGTSEIPSDLPPLNLDRNILTPATLTTCSIMCAIAVSLSVGFALWTRWNQKERVVLASQPMFLYVICLGSLVMASAIVPFIVDQSWASLAGCDLACRFTPWLICIGFSLVFSALFTKTYRANMILNNPTPYKRITVTAYDVIKPMVVVLSANVLVLSIMTAMAPMEWKIIIKDMDLLRGEPSETYGKCQIQSTHIPYIATLSAINFCVLCTAIYQAWRARNLSTEFAESKFIFKSLVTTLAVLFVCGPVVLLAGENPNAYVFVGCGMVFVTSTNTLLWIFVPKMMFIKEKRQRSDPRVSGLSAPSGLNFDDDNSNSQAGERILSTLSPRELIRQNTNLRHRLERIESQKTSQMEAESEDGDQGEP